MIIIKPTKKIIYLLLLYLRFSLDFRIIPKENYIKNKSLEKSNHFSSGKSYFIDFSE